MKLYKNRSANYPYYFVRTGQLNAEPFESGESLSTGYMIELCSEEWQCRKVKCYDSFLNGNFDCIAEVVDVATAMVRVLCELNGTFWEIARVRTANANLLKHLTEQRKQGKRKKGKWSK